MHALSAREALEQWKVDQGSAEQTHPAVEPPSDPAPVLQPAPADPLLAPQDPMALQRGLVKIAQIAHEQGQALGSVTTQLQQVEKRLGALGALEAAAALAAAEAAAAEPAGSPEMAQLGHEVAIAAERTVALDERLTRLEQVRHEVSSTARQADGFDDRLTRLEARTEAVAASGSASALLGARLVRLEQRYEDELAGDDRVQALEDRLDRIEGFMEGLSQLEFLPGALEDLVAERFRESAADLLSLPDDVEGLYKELDTVAERVAARDATVVAHLNRAAKLDVAVKRLREDVGHVIAGLAEVRRGPSTPEPLRRVEERLDALESPDAEVERLRRALRCLVADQADAAAAAGDDRAVAAPSGEVQSLSTEFHRIKRSLEVLPDRPG